MNLDSLNERQLRAATETEGKIRVIAGAGSGKTRALAYRYAYIVNELGIDPSSILCLTFTNKAAQEMKARIKTLVPPGYTNDFVCTIHGFCVKFLREEIFRLGYPKSFQILDEEDMKSLARQVLTENNTERSVKTVRDLLEKTAGYKDANPYIEQYLISTSPVAERSLLPLKVQLIYKQKDKLALDFDDLLAFTLHILHKYDDVRRKWQEKMAYVMVDETQDCNRDDWDLVKILSEACGNLFIVGDPDQSIYEWRGARPDLFVGFASDTDIVLDQNYRSTPGILSVANSIINNNTNRIKKTMFTNRQDGDAIVHFHARDEKEEAVWICSQILKYKDMGAGFADFAVLFRAAHLSRFIEQALIQAGIPYIMWGGVRFFEREEVKDCISYLRLVADDDDLAFERIVNKPSRKVGKVTLEHLTAIAQSEGKSLFQALQDHLGEGRLDRQSLRDFTDLILECRMRKESMAVSALMAMILEKTGLKKEYRDDNDEQRLENITELLESMKLYEQDRTFDPGSGTLTSYMQDIALYTNTDYRKDSDKVRLMTIHQSKGLEFPYVFVIGLSDGIFPNARSIRERRRQALEEERRLMYVATTRAEKCLFLTESEGYNNQAQQEKLPSRFIAEISRELFVTEGNMDEILWKRLRSQIDAEGLYTDTEEHALESDSAPWPVTGSKVMHKVFGAGVVEDIQDNGSCKVRFANGTVRLLRKDVLVPDLIPSGPGKGFS